MVVQYDYILNVFKIGSIRSLTENVNANYLYLPLSVFRLYSLACILRFKKG